MADSSDDDDLQDDLLDDLARLTALHEEAHPAAEPAASSSSMGVRWRRPVDFEVRCICPAGGTLGGCGPSDQSGRRSDWCGAWPVHGRSPNGRLCCYSGAQWE